MPSETSSIISVHPDVMGGVPVFAGTRVPVRVLLDHIEAGDSLTEFLEGYPSVSSYTNGQLVTVAESGFDVFVTSDANMMYQQSLASRKIAVIVLRPKRNRLPEILGLLPQLLTALDSCTAGAFFEVQAS